MRAKPAKSPTKKRKACPRRAGEPLEKTPKGNASAASLSATRDTPNCDEAITTALTYVDRALGTIFLSIFDEFSKQPADSRRLQIGESWNVFGPSLAGAPDHALSAFYKLLLLFAKDEENDLSTYMRLALRCFSLEQQYEKGAKHAASSVRHWKAPGEDTTPLASLVQRLCSWLDAVLHWEIRQGRALFPNGFAHPRDNRTLLYFLGRAQQTLAKQPAAFQDRWHSEHALLVNTTSEGDWLILQSSSAETNVGSLMRAELDRLVIMLWPLSGRYRWTDHDMRRVVRKMFSLPDAYPLRDDREFADYRSKVLSLKFASGERRKSCAGDEPDGCRVAVAMFGSS